MTNREEKISLINEELKKYGLDNRVKIDEGAEDMLLMALTQPDIIRVFIDDEKSLMIEYSD